MSDLPRIGNNVVDFSKYKKDVLKDQPVRMIDQVSDDVPESFQLVDEIGTYLSDERDMLVSKNGPTLFIRWGESEYALTIRPLESHWENLSLWADHVAEKYQQEVAKAKPDEPIDLAVEEVMMLNEMYGDPQESGGR